MTCSRRLSHQIRPLQNLFHIFVLKDKRNTLSDILITSNGSLFTEIKLEMSSSHKTIQIRNNGIGIIWTAVLDLLILVNEFGNDSRMLFGPTEMVMCSTYENKFYVKI